ncbi:MAG TPA: APC family permease [Pyrinomonadaceae bacterium]|jgi:amino acid transporter|nr:APC family permease [Pyrinomonadaceae bacterium]
MATEDASGSTGDEVGEVGVVEREPQLIRGVGLAGATMLNMIDMIGVGPFITIPLIIAAMAGPQAMLGWIFGAVLVICDGLVWAELGAAMPGSGGSYRYLGEIYGKRRLGRLISFLFIWQLTFSAPLSIASGCIGFAMYAAYAFPGLDQSLASTNLRLPLPVVGDLNFSVVVTLSSFVAVGVCLLAVFLLYRKITIIERFTRYLWVGVMLTILWIIVSGVWHFNPALALDFPADAFTLRPEFFTGLGAALLIAVYDYWGYYNVCFFGGEVRDPGRTIPRAVLLSIILVAAIYILMNISILGVIPWREFGATATSDARRYVIASFMERLYGHGAGLLATALIMWTAFASVFSLLLGYSRVPYAAAEDGNYFRIFSRVHAEHRFPYVSLLTMGGIAAAFCFLRLADVIAALVVIRILVQFLAQIVGVMLLRRRRPEMPRPFKMWLYPAPAVVALGGFIYVLFMRPNFQKEMRYALVLIVLGLIVYFIRARVRGEWPFRVGGSRGDASAASQ